MPAISLPVELENKPNLSLVPAAKPKPAYLVRAIAFLIDIFAISVVHFLCNLAMVTAYLHYTHHRAGRFLASENFENYSAISTMICFLAYFTLCYWYTNGKSLGKKICGLRVVGKNEPLSFYESAIRAAVYPLGYVTLSVGFLMPLFRKDGRALHDIVSDTDVVVS